MKKYKIINKFFCFKSKWVEFIGERCEDEKKDLLEYYRVVRCDSLIVLPIVGNKLLFPQKYYRHGISNITLDFPGGRIEDLKKIKNTAKKILKKELSIHSKDIQNIQIINNEGLYVDSSFSTQQVYTCIAYLDEKNFKFNKIKCIEINKDNIISLYNIMKCIQCKNSLMEFYLNIYKKEV